MIRKIGVEFEFPIVYSDGKGADRKIIQQLWTTFSRQYPEWKPIRENIRKTVSGVTRTSGGYSEVIDTDVGVCTIEFSMRPFAHITDMNAHFLKTFQPLRDVAKELGLSILTMGCQPITGYDWSRETQSDYYLVWDRRVTYHNLMVPIAAHQAAVDISVDEWIPVTNMLAALSGPMIALTASSPIFQGKKLPVKEHRAQVWDLIWERQKDPRMAEYLTNDIPHVPFANLNEYFEYLWESRMFFAENKKGVFEMLRKPTFIDFLRNRRPQTGKNAKQEHMLVAPEDSMLTTIANYGWFTNKVHYFFKKTATVEGALDAYDNQTMDDFCKKHIQFVYVENRPCGVAAKGEEMAMPSLTLGLVENWREAATLVEQLTWNEWKSFRVDAIAYSLEFSKNKDGYLGLIKEMLYIAQRGLKRRGLGEEAYLKPFFKRLEHRQSNADDILATFTHNGIPGLLREHSY